MKVIITGLNTIRFNASAEIAFSNYIMEINSISATYNVDVTLDAPVIQNKRYMAFEVTQVASPDITDAEFFLPNNGEYYYTIYNTDTDKDSGNVIFRGVLVLHGAEVTNNVYVSTKENTVWGV